MPSNFAFSLPEDAGGYWPMEEGRLPLLRPGASDLGEPKPRSRSRWLSDRDQIPLEVLKNSGKVVLITAQPTSAETPRFQLFKKRNRRRPPLDTGRSVYWRNEAFLRPLTPLLYPFVHVIGNSLSPLCLTPSPSHPLLVLLRSCAGTSTCSS